MRPRETMTQWLARIDAQAARLATAPHFVYRAYDASGLLLYIGCTVNVEKRMGSHKGSSPWYPYMARLDVTEYPDRQAGRDAETSAINSEGAFFNATRGDINQTQANRLAADKSLVAKGIACPTFDESRLDDAAYNHEYEEEWRRHNALRWEERLRLNVPGKYPFTTPEARMDRYLTAARAAS